MPHTRTSARYCGQLRVSLTRVAPDEIRKLREELGCSLGDLARFVGVEPKTLLAWEAGDLFPTKRHVGRLNAARQPGALDRTKPKPPAAPGLDMLSEPRFWALVAKLAKHPELFAEVEKLAERY